MSPTRCTVYWFLWPRAVSLTYPRNVPGATAEIRPPRVSIWCRHEYHYSGKPLVWHKQHQTVRCPFFRPRCIRIHWSRCSERDFGHARRFPFQSRLHQGESRGNPVRQAMSSTIVVKQLSSSRLWQPWRSSPLPGHSTPAGSQASCPQMDWASFRGPAQCTKGGRVQREEGAFEEPPPSRAGRRVPPNEPPCPTFRRS